MFCTGAGELGEVEEGGELLEAADGLTCPCFVAGTIVEMADGTKKPIQDVQLGELVKSRDPITGEVKAEPVAQVFVHPADALVTVTLSDGERLTCTPSHPFYVAGKGFVPAGELTAGAKLVSGSEATGGAGEAVTISRVAWQKETSGAGTVVYNLGIASTHTYFVASASGNDANGGVWVHNTCNPIKVTPGEEGDDLAQLVRDERARINDQSGNMAVFERQGEDGLEYSFFKSGVKGHAETQGLKAYADDLDSITRVYSEKHPCMDQGFECLRKLGEQVPQAKVYYSIAYRSFGY